MAFHWLPVLVVFFSSPTTVQAQITKQGTEFQEQGTCEQSLVPLNQKLYTTPDERHRTATSPIWVCIPVIPNK